MDGNSSERGRHRHRAHSGKSATGGDPQWTGSSSSDRPQWTQPEPGEPRNWFEKQEPRPDGWRPVSELTDTAWGLNGAWRDPDAAWNVAGGNPADLRDDDTGWTQADAGLLHGSAAPYDAGRSPSPGDREQDAWSPYGAWNSVPEQPAAPAQESWAPPAWADDRASAWADDRAQAWPDASPVAVLERPEPVAEEAAPRKHAVRHPLRLGLFALVLIGLVAGSAAWLSMDKTVQLRIDGDARSVKTFSSTVGGVLDDQKITVAQHDTLAPGRDTKISDGSEIVLRRGRLVTLTVDGQPRQFWTTATTVQEALDQVGYRQDGMFISANRSTRLPLDGYQLTVRMPKNVTFVADGKRRTITTTALTVGEAMQQAGISVDSDDKVSQLSGATVRPGMTITVTRVITKTTTTQTVVEYKTVEKTDPKADPGSRTVQTKGVNGLQEVTRVQTYVDGKLTSSKVAKVTVVKKPVDEVVVLGPPVEEPTSGGGGGGGGGAPPPGQPAECADFPTTGGLNWCGLAKCESGLNPNAYNPAGPYYGLYQFDQQTWTANGGSGSPSGKSIAEQTSVAWTLYQARGAAPWPVCGKNL